MAKNDVQEITVSEAAEELEMTVQNIRHYIYTDRLPARKHFGAYRIRRSDFDRFKKQHIGSYASHPSRD